MTKSKMVAHHHIHTLRMMEGKDVANECKLLARFDSDRSYDGEAEGLAKAARPSSAP